jgi:transposase InsO family protein
MIAPLLDQSLGPAQRAEAALQRANHPVHWPSGDERVIPRATLYRWTKAYRSKGYQGLLPKTRDDKGKARAEDDRPKWIDRAIHLLLERPDRSLTLLLNLLVADFPKLSLTRSTLNRELHRHPSFYLIELSKKRERKLRRRFQAGAPHDIWQLDAKGSFEVTFRDGTRRRYVILTVLDDFSRSALAVILARTESLAAAVRVFRRAANRYGLSAKIYCDRHSVYDSLAFRTGLAILGVHRIRSRAGNASARGKVGRLCGASDERRAGRVESDTLRIVAAEPSDERPVEEARAARLQLRHEGIVVPAVVARIVRPWGRGEVGGPRQARHHRRAPGVEGDGIRRILV